MPINSVSSGGPSLSDIQAVTSAAATAASTAASSAVATATTSNGVSVEISKFGQLRSELDSLAQSDPEKFKAVTADIAQKLKDAAGNETGGKANFLNKLADRFNSASQSGNAADLSPAAGQARGHHHHGGGHHRGRGAGAVGSSGDDGSESVGDVLQGIISGALSAASTPAVSSSSAAATTSGSTT